MALSDAPVPTAGLPDLAARALAGRRHWSTARRLVVAAVLGAVLLAAWAAFGGRGPAGWGLSVALACIVLGAVLGGGGIAAGLVVLSVTAASAAGSPPMAAALAGAVALLAGVFVGRVLDTLLAQRPEAGRGPVDPPAPQALPADAGVDADAQAMLQHASVGIALVRAGRFERVNPAFEAMFGRAAGSLPGQPTAELFDRDATLAAFAWRGDREALDGQAVDVERPARRADGSELLVRLRARAVGTGQPGARASIWVAEDITERQRAQAELAQAKRQAEAASRAKSAFLATMSHEIRTPLGGVLGLARLLQDPGLDDSRRAELLTHLVGAAEQLSGLVSDVLDLSKIEAGHLHIEVVAFDLAEQVQRTFDAFAVLGRERGLAMHCRFDAELSRRVLGDPTRVRQILANFLGNALKFTLRGEVRVRVRRGGGGRVRLEVHDSGPGVAPEQQGRLFEAFAQADGSTTRRYGGTGLGLSICRELAERMDGSVGVDSDGRSGSCFWAELSLPAELLPASPAPGLERGARPLAGLNVLVAEDNPVNMLIVGAMLRRMGAQVLEAQDGEQAVAVVTDGALPVHVVLMDLHMPELDGLAATRRLRAGHSAQALPIYALTASVLDEERRNAAAAGMNGFITKPVSDAELLRTLRALVPLQPAA